MNLQFVFPQHCNHLHKLDHRLAVQFFQIGKTPEILDPAIPLTPVFHYIGLFFLKGGNRLFQLGDTGAVTAFVIKELRLVQKSVYHTFIQFHFILTNPLQLLLILGDLPRILFDKFTVDTALVYAG